MSGWFRSPGGALAHADGPSQVDAFTARGYTEVDDAAARRLIGGGVVLAVDAVGDTVGTFDAADVKRAVAEEGFLAAKRAAAAKKGAETKRRKAAAAAAEAAPGPASATAESQNPSGPAQPLDPSGPLTV